MADWHAERYAAGERLAKAARTIAAEWPRNALPGLRDKWMDEIWLPTLNAALADYDRTRDAP